jgi:hypothetical protein
MIAVNEGRSWNAAVAPPETRHNVMITSRSTAVDAQSPNRGSGPRNTATNHNNATAAYTPRITAYNPGS